MNSRDITPEQGMQVYTETREMLRRIAELTQRMDKRGFSKDDPVYSATYVAWHAIILMNNEWHRVAAPMAFAGMHKKTSDEKAS